MQGMNYRYHRSPQIAPVLQDWVTGDFLKLPQEMSNGWFYVPTAVGIRGSKRVLFMVDGNGTITDIDIDHWTEEGDYLILRTTQANYFTES